MPEAGLECQAKWAMYALIALAGIVVGVVAALVLSRLLAGLLFGIGAQDPLTFGVVGVMLGGVALLAAWLPAIRAVRIDPLIALREE